MNAWLDDNKYQYINYNDAWVYNEDTNIDNVHVIEQIIGGQAKKKSENFDFKNPQQDDQYSQESNVSDNINLSIDLDENENDDTSLQ